jgi:glucokinase
MTSDYAARRSSATPPSHLQSPQRSKTQAAADLSLTSATRRSPATSQVWIGLDIGGSKVLAVAVDASDEVVGRVRLKSRSGPDGVVDVAATAVARLAARLGSAVTALGGIGVGVPGLVDTARGFVVHAVNLDVGSEGLALATQLRERTGLTVSVENDVNAAALGAARTPALVGVDLAYLSIGTGLAAGLVLDGRLRRGRRGAAGEIGHIPVQPDGPSCGCGQRGCLEMVASGRALATAWPAPADESEAGTGPASALFRAASRGEPDAIRVRDTFAAHLAQAVRLLVLAVDVEVVVLGGGVASIGEPLRHAVAAALTTQGEGSAFLRSLELPQRVTLIDSKQPIAALGAALLARDPSSQ